MKNWVIQHVKTGRIIQLKDHSRMIKSTLSGETGQEEKKTNHDLCTFDISESEIYITYLDHKDLKPFRKRIQEKDEIEIGGELFYVQKLDDSKEIQESVTTPPRPKKYAFNYRGSILELIKIIFGNSIMTLLTIGLYIPFGRTVRRKYFWRSTYLNNHPFTFLGDAKKLLIPFLILHFSVCLIALAKISGLYLELLHLPYGGVALMGMIFLGYMTYQVISFRGLSYLLKNTSYRGVKFSLNKKKFSSYLIHVALGPLLIPLSLGLYYPFWSIKKEKLLWSGIQYGNLPFQYEPSGLKYGLLYLKGLILTILTLGLYAPWFRVSLFKYRFSNLKLPGAVFVSKATGLDYLKNIFKFTCISILTLGIANLYYRTFLLTYFINQLEIQGEINFDEIIAVETKKSSGFSENLMDEMEVEFDVA